MSVDPEKRREYQRKYYQANRDYFSKWYADNKEKILEQQRKRRNANPEKSREKSRKWRENNPEKARESCWKSCGIDLDWLRFELLLELQDYTCPICLGVLDKASNRTVPDHCHTTGTVRGILCTPCNTALGKLKDDPENFLRAVEYLRNPPAR